jgi:hypothetical protein
VPGLAVAAVRAPALAAAVVPGLAVAAVQALALAAAVVPGLAEGAVPGLALGLPREMAVAQGASPLRGSRPFRATRFRPCGRSPSGWWTSTVESPRGRWTPP